MSQPPEPIVVIGTGCRFPGNSSTPSKLWSLLSEPRDLLQSLAARFNPEGWHHDNGKHHGHCNVKDSYLLEGSHRFFDAQFFGVNAVEASTIDPQMRLLLETVYEALEAAGLPIETLRGSDTAVYTGMMGNSYKTAMERDLDSIGTYHVSGVSRAMMSNRLSYFFDWHGPSMTIDTACSSSLIAVHQAVQQLRNGQSRVAIAAGSNLLLDPTDYVAMSKLEMLSAESRSRMWDKAANGYARGEGVAAIVLKTLSAAEADGDHIECVIRETATNQDGRTPGITMPSAAAQARLIRDCYARAGLDPTNRMQGPQYFEAHGTGTPAGDPVEAEAIATAFFPIENAAEKHQHPLYVGGIKTVIGHSESVAGLAGLIKTSLALQNGTVPPNLLFQELNPNILPFYRHLQIPTSSVPWPNVVEGPRRASVNSFGFGGANAHAILESYTAEKRTPSERNTYSMPFVFSAASESSLLASMKSFCDYLTANEAGIDLRDLAMTLHSRRSRLPYGTAIAADTVEELCHKLKRKIQEAGGNSEQPVGIRPTFQQSGDRSVKPRILGIFTGQGAQCARMGAALIEQSTSCRAIIEKLELRLAELPLSHRPSWSLMQELLKDDTSRVGQAAFSQPLCTALQILQVDLLRAAGVEFSAVVGHSSGEIGAAYCAGMISAEEAICIAYYRGMGTDSTGATQGLRGAMLAVGTSFEDAQEICCEEEFKARVSVAAVNSSASVTLSGDEDAIDEIKIIFEDEGKFVRRLKVEKAYHSFHMAPFSNTYLQALQSVDVRPGMPTTSWFSSVHGGKLMGNEESTTLKASYWKDNMVRPVLFKQALESALAVQGPFDLAVELGPHPALQGPALQTIQDLSSQVIPYTGVHMRNKNALESFADSLGYIWTHLATVDLPTYIEFLSGYSGYNVVKGIPSYAWEHTKQYWHESRHTKAILARSEPVHELLGHRTPDSTDQDMRWRNILTPKEIPWIKGHALQQQAVFPAAGYVVAAIEAAAAAAKLRGFSVSLIEVLDFDIGKALTFDTDDTRMETITSLADIRQRGNSLEAIFKFSATPTLQGTALALLAGGSIRVTLGEGQEDALPSRGTPESGLGLVDAEDFYASLSRLDYQYTGPFRALFGLSRKLGSASGFITNEASSMLIHPAVLDAAFQSVLLAHCAPNSGGIWALHVPKTIRVIRVNPMLCGASKTGQDPLAFDCTQPPGGSSLEGDVDLYSVIDGVERTAGAVIQVEALHCVPFALPSAQDDKIMFTKTIWDVAMPVAESVAHDSQPTEGQRHLAGLLERMAVFYLRRLAQDIPKNHPARAAGPYTNYFTFASHMLSRAKEGSLPLWSSAWEQDSADQLSDAYEPFLHIADVKLLKAFGDKITDIVTGRTQAIEVGMQDAMLSKYYEQALGFEEHTTFLARLVKQIVHRYPQMNILEVGAGTGGATKGVFREIGQTFASYTYTDISSGFFETAQEVFAPHVDKMLFKVLDISKDTRQQGYDDHAYDLIIASAVLHATPSLQNTLKNVRRLLKPGGFLVVLELQLDDIARIGTIFGALPGWWLGANEGRTLSPCVDLAKWDELLRMTGFSGCDTVTPVRDGLVMPLSVFVSQAVDRRVEFIREPLDAQVPLFQDNEPTSRQNLILLGGSGFKTARTVAQLKSILRLHWGQDITTARSLADVVLSDVTAETTVLSLLEIDAPVFKDLEVENWEVLRSLLQEAGTILWVSSNRRAENPHANMMVGMLRSARHEIPTLDIQCFDIEGRPNLDARELAETLSRLKATATWQRRDGHNSLLATVEPEIVRQEDGTLLIPRVVASRHMNDRYNSSRRDIYTRSSANEEVGNLAIKVSEKNRAELRQVPRPEKGQGAIIEVTHSSGFAIPIAGSGHFYLILGSDCDSGHQVVALSRQHMLRVSAPTRLSLSVSVPPGDEARFLVLLGYHLLASMFLENLREEASVIIHEPNAAFAAVIADEAKRRNAQIIFTTTSTTPTRPGWHVIHPKAPDRTLRASIPKNIAVLVFASAENVGLAFRSRFRAQLPTQCVYHEVNNINALASSTSGLLPEAQTLRVQARLGESVSRSLLTRIPCATHTISLDSLAQLQSHDQKTVIDWSLNLLPESGLSVRVQPAASQIQFSDCRTYWLAGLSGGLGLLLCEWMVRHGARYVVISSRSPRVEESWLAKMHDAGATVKVFACDITDKIAVSDLYSNILSTLPPFAGVCQGAMVLEDTALRDMSLEALLKVTRPKVEGSIHLEQLFKAPDPDLEFFIFFSSAGSIIGQPGQGNYAAANLFMTALAGQRRRRGQVASVMHIGPIFGVGYISQQGRDSGSKLLENLKSISKTWFPLSEQDFCHHFAEAVIAGRVGSQSNCLEVTTGLAKFASYHEAGPLLSHHTQSWTKQATGITADKSTVSLKSRLADAQGRDQVTDLIREAFFSKLSALFQMELSELESADPTALRLDEMGIDSLMAVEIRSWFVKTLQVNIPVLKILNGALVSELVEVAVETIPKQLVPSIDGGGPILNAADRNVLADTRAEAGAPRAHQGVSGPSDRDAPIKTHNTKSPMTVIECLPPVGTVGSDVDLDNPNNIHLTLHHRPTDDSIGINHQRSDSPAPNKPVLTSVEANSILASFKLADSQMAKRSYNQRWTELEADEGISLPISDQSESAESQSHITSSSDTLSEDREWLKVPKPSSTIPSEDENEQKTDISRLAPYSRQNTTELENDFKLSFSQSLFWFSGVFSDSSTDLNLTTTFRMNGDLHVERLKTAVQALGQQHESLRTCFFVKDGLPRQGIMTSSALRLEHYRIGQESELVKYIKEMRNHVYDLEKGKTIRLAIISMSSTRHFFLIGVHHLAMDGASFQPLMRDLLQHYKIENHDMTARQYPDFSERQHEEFASGGFKNEIEFWRTELTSMPPELPMLRTSSRTLRPALRGYGNTSVDVRIGSDTKVKIQALCRKCRATPFHYHLAVFRVLLWRYTGSEDFSIGIGDANRTDEDLMGSIGDFVNMLPLAFRTEASRPFESVLQETRSKTHAALANSRVPFQLLLNELGVARSADTTPIFQAFMDYRLARGEKMTWGENQLELLSFDASKVAYDVAVDIIDNADGDCLLTFIVRDDIYSREDAEQFARSYVHLAETFAAQSSLMLGKADIFDEQQLDQALILGRGPLYQSRDWGETLVHRVEDMARRYPSRPAVISGDGNTISYEKLINERVLAIATELRIMGVTPGSRVAVLQEPTPDWVSSILAIMRVGAVYVPLDVGLPLSRLADIVEDCQPHAVLVEQTTKDHAHKLGFQHSKVSSVSGLRLGNEGSICAVSDSICTILYTSGSTGTPKGIMLTHQGLRSWLEPCAMLYGMRPSGEVVLQQSSQGFDMSLMQIFSALCFGGSVYLLPRKFRGDASVISEQITKYGISQTYGTPSEYLSWLRYGDTEALRQSAWKTALMGGELLSPSVLKEFSDLGKHDLRLHHMYGTTEATFCSSVTELDYTQHQSSECRSGNTTANYPAGVSLPNYNVYVLDEQMRPLPAGLQGEIYIGGAGVSRGYLNQTSLSAETFVSDPFATADDKARGWKMMQKTGDLGRWSQVDHGAILIEGRISGDTMVKLRGLRVDLREVEVAILRAGADVLSEALVSVRRSSPDSPEFLVAHVVLSADSSGNGRHGAHEKRLQKIRSQLEIPLYMRPAFIISLETLPITSSGKLDRKAISSFPMPECVSQGSDVVLSPTEEKLKTLWEEVLSRDLSLQGIDSEADFFHIGGTSMSLLGLRERIRSHFGVELALVDLFEASVLASMANRIDGQVDLREVIDWDEETKLRSHVIGFDGSTAQGAPQSLSRVVVLTGGTGHLGKGLIYAMIRDPTVREIHCLGVRNVASRNDLKALDKVILYEGDLNQPRLGLSQSTTDDLFSRADLIIHNGADISYMKTYQSMRQSNFLTTKDLTELSLPRMIPFHFISTAGIGNFAPGSPLLEASVAATPPPTDGSAGYTACKWASETYLEKLVAKFPKWPVCVHRPTLISRDDISELDGVHNILGYARQMGAVPMSQGVARGVLNVVQRDVVVEGVLKCALQRDDGGQSTSHRDGEVHFVNHKGDVDLPLSNMRKWALEHTVDGQIAFSDVDFEEIPLDEWVRKAVELGMHPTMAALLTTFARDGEVEFPTIGKGPGFVDPEQTNESRPSFDGEAAAVAAKGSCKSTGKLYASRRTQVTEWEPARWDWPRTFHVSFVLVFLIVLAFGEMVFRTGVKYVGRYSKCLP